MSYPVGISRPGPLDASNFDGAPLFFSAVFDNRLLCLNMTSNYEMCNEDGKEMEMNNDKVSSVVKGM